MNAARTRCSSPRLLRSGALLVGLLTAAAVSVAQSIDYDPRRPAELRPCDDQLYRGRVRARADLLFTSAAVTESHHAGRSRLGAGRHRARQPIVSRADSLECSARSSRACAGAGCSCRRTSTATRPQNFRKRSGSSPTTCMRSSGSRACSRIASRARRSRWSSEALQQDDNLIEAHLLTARMALEEGQLEPAQSALDRATHLAEQQRQPPLEVYSTARGARSVA